MEWERGLPVDPGRLFMKEEKRRSFSTSTPFMSGHIFGKAGRSLSVNAFTPADNDSGLGYSLADEGSTVSVDASKYPGVDCDVTTTFCTLTPCNRQVTSETGIGNGYSDLIHSPVSSKGPKFFTRRSLDSSMRSVDHERTPFDNHSSDGHILNCVRRLNLDLDITGDTALRTPDISEIQLSKQFNEVLSKFSPPDPSNLIGRRMGRDNVDILGDLWGKNFPVVVSSILDMLEPKDLCRMCVVSRQWKTLCESDTVANSRRKHFLKKRQRRLQMAGKENLGKRTSSQVGRGSQGPGVLQALTAVQRQCDPPPGQSPPLSTADQFVQVAKCLKNDEKLQKCPKCRKPAKVLPVQERGQCQNDDCHYDYCTKCLYSFHGSKDCVPISNKRQKTDCIGAKKSKKNLKRL